MVQNGRISDFHGLLNVTLTLDPGMVITFIHLSSSTIPVYQISSKSKKYFVDGRTDGRKFATIVLGCLPKFGSRPKNERWRRPPSSIIKNHHYVGRDWSDLVEIWHSEVVRPSWRVRPFKIIKF